MIVNPVLKHVPTLVDHAHLHVQKWWNKICWANSFVVQFCEDSFVSVGFNLFLVSFFFTSHVSYINQQQLHLVLPATLYGALSTMDTNSLS
jgi:hypothetical protein